MHNAIAGIDHVIIAVRDLDAAMAAYGSLGFTLTPKGHHARWGTANACAMFGDTYIELLAAEGDGEVAGAVRAFTAGREGMMEVVFATPDIEAARAALGRAGLDVPPATDLARRIPADGGEAEARFRVTALPPAATPGVAARLCQHLSPDLLRRPEWLAHPNGALAIASVTAVVEEPLDLQAPYAATFGPGAPTATDDTLAIHTGRGLIFLSRPEDLSQLHLDADEDEPPHPPALVALTVRVADTAAAAAFLKKQGVEFSRDPEGTVRVPPSETCGLYLEMVAE